MFLGRLSQHVLLTKNRVEFLDDLRRVGRFFHPRGRRDKNALAGKTRRALGRGRIFVGADILADCSRKLAGGFRNRALDQRIDSGCSPPDALAHASSRGGKGKIFCFLARSPVIDPSETHDHVIETLSRRTASGGSPNTSRDSAGTRRSKGSSSRSGNTSSDRSSNGCRFGRRLRQGAFAKAPVSRLEKFSFLFDVVFSRR